MKYAIVTGATRGIGLAISKKLIKEGYEVFGTYVSSDELAEKLNTDIEQLTLIKVDSGNIDEIDKFINAVKGEIDHLDLLVNNAGIDLPGKISEYELDSWERMINVNLKSYFYISKKCIPLLKKSKDSPSMVNVSSRLGIPEKALSPYIMYGITKAGVSVLTKGLAKELDEFGIRVNAVFPPTTETDMLKEVVPEKIIEKIRERGDLGKPDEVADLVMQLVNDKEAQGKFLFDERV